MAPPPAAEPNEVLLRVAIRTRDRQSARRFGHEIAPLIMSGLPGACGAPGLAGRPDPAPIINFWPALVPRDAVTPRASLRGSVPSAGVRWSASSCRTCTLNFVLHGALDGGGLRSLRIDRQGNTYGYALLRMPIEVPDGLDVEDLAADL